jgi:hypothetical protein
MFFFLLRWKKLSKHLITQKVQTETGMKPSLYLNAPDVEIYSRREGALTPERS